MNYSRGFYLEELVGNNEFSYKKRDNKKIYVPSIIEVIPNKLEIMEKFKISKETAFSEYDYEKKLDININGLENFLYVKKDDKQIYIFDNHNHSFYFLSSNMLKKIFEDENYCSIVNEFRKLSVEKIFDSSYYIEKFIKNMNGFFEIPKYKMIHFDQHKDMRIPNISLYDFSKNVLCKKDGMYSKLFNIIKSDINIKNIFDILDKLLFLYTNYHLNVGNFIVPLKENNFIDDVVIVDSTYSIYGIIEDICKYDDVVLDIDLDFFSEDMGYICDDIKFEAILKCYEKASIVTICTSPYFIEFERAKKYLDLLLDKFNF